MTKTLYIPQINELKSIENLSGLLLSFPEIDEVKIDLDNKTVIIELNNSVSDEMIRYAIKSLGKYEIEKSTKYYAVYFLDTNSKIVYDNWDECKNAIKGKKNRYKKFDSFKLAVEWLDSGTNYETNIQNQPLLQNAVYFDAGTGRNIGVEVRITDINKNSLLHFVLDKTKINQYGNYTLTNRTNNFGELSGLFFALKYAKEYNIKDICGDSNLVIKYWANGIYNKGNLDNDTIKLIEIVNKMYIEFKKNGGILHKISGDINPSDLGFHK